MRYTGSLYRPPSEADSLILQATLGCSYNQCTFCGMYRDKPFRVRPLAELEAEIEWARRHLPGVRKIFLADGDALVAKASFLEALLDRLAAAFPALRRVSVYASPQSLQLRTVEEMARLRGKGLTLYYLGVESGDDATLAALRKGVDGAEMVAAAAKATAAGVKLSTMILLGAGGRARWREHARGSARVINAIQPRFLSTLVMTPVPGTPLAEEAAAGRWREPDPLETARELREFLAGLDLRGTIFRSNHASNWLALAGTLPKDRPALLALLDRVLADPAAAVFRPGFMRGL
ncbi:MAG: radical SAM protein [Planctomycetota bacterium]|nr:MAG: radical SAM protein [Planctomycetota bacterium]